MENSTTYRDDFDYIVETNEIYNLHESHSEEETTGVQEKEEETQKHTGLNTVLEDEISKTQIETCDASNVKALGDTPKVSEAHRKYFKTAGIEIFKRNLENGYSLMGAAFLLGQSATESGYGNMSDLESKIAKNNYWGMKYKGKTITYSSFDKGYDAWDTMMKERFSDAVKLLLKDNFTVEELQQALNPGDGKYNYDPKNDNYAKYMFDVAKNGLKRMISVLDDEIKSMLLEAEDLVVRCDGDKRVFTSSESERKFNALHAEAKDFQQIRVKAKEALKKIEQTLEQAK